ncbi:MAG: RagB/SusD family nutrient uptake outer membrane protein [Ekhidna sp.]|nr:RagB/SusD family nutrient uptake outer membrane protein [Ekhidna sp.]
MKKLILFTLFSFILMACGELDIQPRNGLTENVAFENFEGIQSYIGKVYSSLTHSGQEGPAGDPDLSIIPDEGFSSYLRVFWKAQELTTDEAIIAWDDNGIRDLHDHNWSASNPFLNALYYRIFYTISLANDFLRVADEYVPSGLTDEEEQDIEFFKAEARFIRAYAYFHALDLFRNIPLLTVISSDLPMQSSPQGVFDFIESELNEIESLLLPISAANTEYGRVNQGAVHALLSRLYLNAEVYTGTARFADCITASRNLINLNQYSLANSYPTLFMGDNHTQTDEIIWAIAHDGEVSQSWGGTTMIVRGGIGEGMQDDEKNGVPYLNESVRDYGVPNGWNGWRTTRALVDKFPGASTSTDASSVDGRAIFFNDGQLLEIADVADFTHGYAAPKFNNIEASTGQRALGVDHVSTDFPVFRLAEVYLNLAEAQLRLSGIDGTTLGYLNALRTRAYEDNSGNVSISDVTLEWLLDERSRELYLEGLRRTDLVRFESFTGSTYLWPWKGGTNEGKSTPDYLDVFPIPSTELISNPNMVQNTGY